MPLYATTNVTDVYFDDGHTAAGHVVRDEALAVGSAPQLMECKIEKE